MGFWFVSFPLVARLTIWNKKESVAALPELTCFRYEIIKTWNIGKFQSHFRGYFVTTGLQYFNGKPESDKDIEILSVALRGRMN